jgi:hypothetical protein
MQLLVRKCMGCLKKVSWRYSVRNKVLSRPMYVRVLILYIFTVLAVLVGDNRLRQGRPAGYEQANIGHCGGVDPLRSARSSGARRAGHGEPWPIQELAPHRCGSMCVCKRERASAIHHCQGCRGLGLTNTLSGCSGTPQIARMKRYTGDRRTPRKDEGRLGCSGRTALRRGQCDRFTDRQM